MARINQGIARHNENYPSVRVKKHRTYIKIGKWKIRIEIR